MVWGLAIGAASSLVGGLVGGSDAREAERRNIEQMNLGLGDFEAGFGALDDAEFGALTDLDYANDILAGIEPAVLNGLDEQLRVRVAQQVRQNQQQQMDTQARLASAGLDVSTVGAGLQRSQAFGQAQEVGALSAAFAGQRASAIGDARRGVAQGYGNRANLQASFGSQRANLFAQQANFRGGYQFEAPNTGALIGQIGGMIGNGIDAYQSGQREEKYNNRYLDALEAMGGGGGRWKPRGGPLGGSQSGGFY